MVRGINILRNNYSEYAASVGFIDVEGTVHFNNNLVVDNLTPAAGGLSIERRAANAIAYVTNNTIANNMTGNATAGFVYIENNNPADPTRISATTSCGTTSQVPTCSFSAGIQFNNNDIAVINGFQTAGSGANLRSTPGFVSSSDFHLAGTSSLLGDRAVCANWWSADGRSRRSCA